MTIGVDLLTYRHRIGVFGPERFTQRVKGRNMKYCPFVKGSDIHLRSFIMFRVILGTLYLSINLVRLIDSLATISECDAESVSATTYHTYFYLERRYKPIINSHFDLQNRMITGILLQFDMVAFSK